MTPLSGQSHLSVLFTFYMYSNYVHVHYCFSCFSDVLTHLDMSSLSPLCSSLILPFPIHSVLPFSSGTGSNWLIIDNSKK